jgi:hypothetical protein
MRSEIDPETLIRQHHLEGLEGLPAGEFILPHYDGLSIANLPATAVALLGGALPGAPPPLPHDLWADWTPGLKRVILVILDAVGYLRLRQHMALDEDLGIFQRLVSAGRFFPLTTVFPSTTTSALATFWTGRTPAEHGLVGYELYLREYGVLSNLIAVTPAYGKQAEMLVEWGLKPDKFLPVPDLVEQLEFQNIAVRGLTYRGYINSGMSRIIRRSDDETRGYVTLADLWTTLRQMLRQRPQEPQNAQEIIIAYWGGMDGVAHTYGPGSENWQAELRSIAYSLEREFLRPLSSQDRDGTLLLITSDHGQVYAPPEQATSLTDHPALRDMLIQPLSGESRAAYLFVRHGRMEDVRAYLADHLTGRFVLLDSAAALTAGLFGRGTPAPETPFRIGDLLALARGQNTLRRGNKKPKMIGRHGGLSPEEMLVPLIGARLDALREG